MILEQIAADTRLRLIEEKKLVSPEEMKEKALALAADETFPFEKMLKEPGIHYICEVKKASPSKGLIAEDFPYLQIAKEYEAAGADAISCLTEPKYFLGKKEYLKAITDEVSIPVLRKDFTVDEYQIYEAKTLVQTVPQGFGKCFHIIRNCDQFRFSFETWQRIAVALISMDEMSFACHTVFICKRVAVAGIRISVIAL